LVVHLPVVRSAACHEVGGRPSTVQVLRPQNRPPSCPVSTPYRSEYARTCLKSGGLGDRTSLPVQLSLPIVPQLLVERLVFEIFAPLALVPLEMTVRVRSSADTTMRDGRSVCQLFCSRQNAFATASKFLFGRGFLRLGRAAAVAFLPFSSPCPVAVSS
jgi:hypothetical protein